jgi:hypothetical protein
MTKKLKLGKEMATEGREPRLHIVRNLIEKGNKKSHTDVPRTNYKKSVSPSLVYRPLTLEKRQYVGFKVTYCGKGKRAANFDRRKLSVILIPDINYIRSYRPIAGAVARQTRAEVICCAYQKIETSELNAELVDSLVERMRFQRSKLRSIQILSENERLFEILKQRLNSPPSNNGVEITTPTEEISSQIELEEAPLSSPDLKPNDPSFSRTRQRRIKFVQISREQTEPPNKSAGIFKRVLSSIKTTLGELFSSNHSSNSTFEDDSISESNPSFHFSHENFLINRNMNLSNTAHCDLIAKLMMSS